MYIMYTVVNVDRLPFTIISWLNPVNFKLCFNSYTKPSLQTADLESLDTRTEVKTLEGALQ